MSEPGKSGVIENLIFDLGCHRGEDTAYYLQRGFRVVAVECVPAQIAAVKSRFATELADGRLTLVERAIAPKAGPETFYQNNSKSVWGTADKAWAERNRALGTDVEEITVEGILAEDLFDEYGIPFYLKIDLEGRDLLAVHALERFQVRPPYLSIEAEARSMQALRSEFDALCALGYNRFKLSAQQHVVRQTVPGSSVQGRPVVWNFEPGSSGMFGEDLPGPWQNLEDALKDYEPIMLIYDVERAIQQGILVGSLGQFLTKFGYELGWYDTHARHESWSGRAPRAVFGPGLANGSLRSPKDEHVAERSRRAQHLVELLGCCGPLRHVARVCDRQVPGIDEVREWQVWVDKRTTPDQSRIEEQLETLVSPSTRLLHIGAGNSSLALRFSHRVGQILGTTLHEEECTHAESLGLPNYTVLRANKYSQDMDELTGTFDFIVDNNPASFACCLFHFARMMEAYKDLLGPGGQLLMAQPGMRWVVPSNDPNWSLSEADWKQVGNVLNMPIERLSDHVYAMRCLDEGSGSKEK